MLPLNLDYVDRTESALTGSWADAQKLAGLFQFERHERQFDNIDALRGCYVTCVHPVERVTGPGWGEKGPPHPGVFEEVFPKVVSGLVDADTSIYLHIKGIDDSYFDEVSAIKERLRPLGCRYVLLAPVARQTHGDIGNLIFECPQEFLPFVASNWLSGPWTWVEGYAIRHEDLGKLVSLYYSPDSVATIRALLTITRCAFRLWTDTNGICVFSETMTAETLRASIAI
jgi:hypothetical protein